MSDITKLHDLVWVFHNAIDRPQDIIDFYEQDKDWVDWYTLGTMVDIYINTTFDNPTLPSKEDWTTTVKPHPEFITDKETPYVRSMLDTFYDVSRHYFNALDITLPSYIFKSFSLAKYTEGGRMNYHTDFQQDRAHFPGIKFHTTCLFYLNDDYEGGEISFAILNDSNTAIIDYFEYKPKQGDVLIFPSKDPFFHGVKPITKGNKYIIRTYWQYDQKPTPNYNPHQAEKLYKSLRSDVKTGFTLEHSGKILFFNAYKK